MSRAPLAVWLHGEPVATIDRSRDPPRWQWGESTRTPVSLSMPAHGRAVDPGTVRSWLGNLLPDNELVVERWSREFQVAPNALALLGTPVGLDVAGAVQFAPEGVDVARPHQLAVLDDTAFERHLAALANDESWLGSPENPGYFSLGGAQAKAALASTGDGWAKPSGAAPSTHLFKPAIPGFGGHEVVEHFGLRTAGQLGLAVAPSELLDVGDHRFVVVERFDRRRLADGTVRRVHAEDLCQALAITSVHKYQGDGGPGPIQIAELLATRIVDVAARRRSLRAFGRALLYSWMTLGTDAHAKNYTVLLAGGEVRLAPLYDLSSVLAYPGLMRRGKVRLAMKLGRYDPYGISRGDLRRLATQIRVAEATLLGDAEAMAAELPDAMSRVVEAHDGEVADRMDTVRSAIVEHLDTVVLPALDGRPFRG